MGADSQELIHSSREYQHYQGGKSSSKMSKLIAILLLEASQDHYIQIKNKAKDKCNTDKFTHLVAWLKKSMMPRYNTNMGGTWFIYIKSDVSDTICCQF